MEIRCKVCLDEKPESEFQKRKLNSGNISYRKECRSCQNKKRALKKKHMTPHLMDKNKEHWRRRREQLLDPYIKTLFRGIIPTKEQIEQKRMTIKIKRKINELRKTHPQPDHFRTDQML